jgi:hypothetical protein
LISLCDCDAEVEMVVVVDADKGSKLIRGGGVDDGGVVG